MRQLKHILDRTTPRAAREYVCQWDKHPSHVIPKGETYVRLVFKGDDGSFMSAHYCVKCWDEMGKEDENTAS